MNKRGFTLLELLVVVLIIGILASIALPQYQMAVTKAKVASILPLMRRWKDALQEYKLQHGNYADEKGFPPDADTLGANWPSDWECNSDNTGCWNDYWNECLVNDDNGNVYCSHQIDDDNYFLIIMNQSDSLHEDIAGITTCEATGEEANKVCKALGGKLLEDVSNPYGNDYIYKLN